MTSELIEGTSPQGLTPRELAVEIKDRLGLSKAPTAQTIRNWMAGGMPCLSRGDHGVASRLDPDACERWIRANKSGLGRGGERERAGRKKKRTTKNPNREARGQAQWRTEPEGDDPRLVSDEMLDEADRKARASQRLAELAGTSGAEAAGKVDGRRLVVAMAAMGNVGASDPESTRAIAERAGVDKTTAHRWMGEWMAIEASVREGADTELERAIVDVGVRLGRQALDRVVAEVAEARPEADDLRHERDRCPNQWEPVVRLGPAAMRLVGPGPPRSGRLVGA